MTKGSDKRTSSEAYTYIYIYKYLEILLIMKAFTSHGVSHNYTEIYKCIYVYVDKVFHRYIPV